MLKEIVDSKTDSAVLSFFLAAPQRSFSVMEIARRLGLSNLKAAHSLNKLAAQGPLRAFSKKGKKYYLINAKYKLFPELKSYWQKEGPKYHDELFSAIRQLGEIKAAFLSGLFCGQANLPVDLLLVGKVNLNKLADFLKQTEKLMGQEINYSIMSVDEFLERRDTFDRFIKDIFDYSHLVVVDELGKRKK
ncbi:MAG TPA: hypothetical protein VHA30_00425 [Patescibacteria group bacterium]|nr:hypothetical protein [Patescibacteria group bacterium]